MDKKNKILIVLIIILLIFIFLFVIISFNNEKPLIQSTTIITNENIPYFTSDERINRIIFNSHHLRELRKKYGRSVFDENSLINLVHIIKKESGYKISCEFGPAYETANLNEFYPGELVSMGQIKDCSIETAEAIDKAVKSPEVDCRIPITSVYSPYETLASLKDYYLVTLDFEEHIVTQEWVDKTKDWICFKPLEGLKGEKVAIKFITGIVDIKTNRIYY